ncbi:GNAT family N-acetyltransferase [Pseudovibrio flavus]|uniref:GNAT family N-acetyltransferase n=1 Tax=Pseudovibrio flavus TaxID=2529854 RepID=UPI00211CBA70|nr:GNAT family N-acetyltransferase [Pseudovibrio flavus]
MQIEIIEDMQRFLELKENWSNVYKNDPDANYYMSWRWFRQVFERRPQGWFILAAKSNDQSGYVGFFPLRRRLGINKKKGFFYDQIFMAGNFSSDYTGYLVDSKYDEQVIPAFAKFLSKQPWARLQMESLRSSPERLSLFMSGLTKGPFEFRDIPRTNKADGVNTLICPYAELPESYDEFLQTNLSSKTRQKMRRFTRKMEADETMEIRQIDEEHFDEQLDILLSFWRAKWAKRKGKRIDYLVSEYKLIFGDAYKDGSLFIPVFWREGRPIGGLFSFIDKEKGELLFVLASRDESVSDFPSGLVLHGHSIEWAINNGIRSYDFLRGDEAYKYSYGPKERFIQSRLISTRSRRNQGDVLDPSSLNEVFKIATQSHKKGNYKLAEGGYRQILKSRPDHPKVLYSFGQLLMHQDRPEDAVSVYQTLTETHPDNVKVWLRYALALAKSGEFDQARKAYRFVLSLAPNHILANVNLAQLLLKASREDEAISHFKACLKAVPQQNEDQRLQTFASKTIKNLRPLENTKGVLEGYSAIRVPQNQRSTPRPPWQRSGLH